MNPQEQQAHEQKLRMAQTQVEASQLNQQQQQLYIQEQEKSIIKDQLDSDFCTAFAVINASEIQEQKRLSPEWQFMKIKNGDKSWGSDLRTACKSCVKFGSIPQEKVNISLTNASRDTILDASKWDSKLDIEAFFYKKKSYFKVDSFQEVKQAIYKNKVPVITGVKWRNSWNYIDSSGIIPIDNENSEEGSGHAFVYTGWKIINDKEYLIATLSNGMIGNKGKFYFSKECFEKESKYGNFVFVDLNREDAEWYLSYGIKANDNWIISFIKIIKKWIFA